MRKYLRLLACLLLNSALGSAECCAAASDARPLPVGQQSIHFEDASRRNWRNSGARPLETLIWYPAIAGTQETAWEVAIFKAGRSAKGAAMAANPLKLPLIVLSHGTGGSAAGLAWLGEVLAANGYIVAAPNHHGNTGAEPTQPLQGTLIWWDRPQDVSALIDRLLHDPQFGPRIDSSRIGVAGFSIGAYTALASAGARLSRSQWQRFCAVNPFSSSCKLPPEVSERYSEDEAKRLLAQDERMISAAAHMDDLYLDPRVKAAFAIAPVEAMAMSHDSLAAIAIPVRIVVGAEDDQAHPRDNAEALAAVIPLAELTVLPKVTHYSFLPVCNDKGKAHVRELCTDPPGVDRDEVHERVSRDAVDFFARALRAGP